MRRRERNNTLSVMSLSCYPSFYEITHNVARIPAVEIIPNTVFFFVTADTKLQHLTLGDLLISYGFVSNLRIKVYITTNNLRTHMLIIYPVCMCKMHCFS